MPMHAGKALRRIGAVCEGGKVSVGLRACVGAERLVAVIIGKCAEWVRRERAQRGVERRGEHVERSSARGDGGRVAEPRVAAGA